MQKLILVIGDDTEELNKLLDKGWVIRDFKSSGTDIHVYAYVLLEKGSKVLNE